MTVSRAGRRLQVLSRGVHRTRVSEMRVPAAIAEIPFVGSSRPRPYRFLERFPAVRLPGSMG